MDGQKKTPGIARGRLSFGKSHAIPGRYVEAVTSTTLRITTSERVRMANYSSLVSDGSYRTGWCLVNPFAGFFEQFYEIRFMKN